MTESKILCDAPDACLGMVLAALVLQRDESVFVKPFCIF
jgi:hypothetical protein